MGFEPDPNFKRNFDRIVSDLKKKVEGDVPLTQLFPDAFMAEHTVFGSIEAMFAASPLAETPADEIRDALHTPEWDAFVAEHTRFPTWQEMLVAAGREEVQRRLKD